MNTINIAFYSGDQRVTTFDVEVSNDGLSWTKVLTNAKSSGTTLALEAFTFPLQFTKYIRLTGHGNSVNLWNSYAEVGIDIVDPTTGLTDVGNQFFSIFPNPVVSELNIIATANNNAEIRLMDLFGNVVLTEYAVSTDGQINTQLSLAHLASGIYFVSVNDGENIQQRKVMIQ